MSKQDPIAELMKLVDDYAADISIKRYRAIETNARKMVEGEPALPLTCPRSRRSDCALFDTDARPSKEWYAKKIMETDGLDDALPSGALAAQQPDSKMVEGEPVAEIIQATEVNILGELTHQRDIDYYQDDIENLPVGTLLYAAAQPAPAVQPDELTIAFMAGHARGVEDAEGARAITAATAPSATKGE